MTPALLLGLTVRPVLAWMAEACGIPHTAEAERMLLAIAMPLTIGNTLRWPRTRTFMRPRLPPTDSRGPTRYAPDRLASGEMM